MSSDFDHAFMESRRKLMGLSIEQLRELYQGDYVLLAQAFMIELSGEESPFELSQIWKRWLPLIRDEMFVQTIEQRTVQMEAEAPEKAQRLYLQNIRTMAREMNRWTEESVKEYFSNRDDSQKFDVAVAEGQAQTEYDMAIEAAARGDLVGARIHYERAISAFESIGNKQMRAQSTLNLANVILREGQFSQAEKLYGQAIVAFQELGDTTNLGLTLCNLSHLMLTKDQMEQAHQFAAQGLEVLTQRGLGEDDAVASCVNQMLQAAESLPLPKKVERYQQIILVLEEAKLQKNLARIYLVMADALAQMNRLDEGYEAATRGVKLMVASGAPPQQVQWAFVIHGHIWTEMGRSTDEWLVVSKELLAAPDTVARLGDICRALTEEIDSEKLDLDQGRRRLREMHACEPFDAQAVTSLASDIGNMLRPPSPTPPVEVLKKLEVYLHLLILAAELTGSYEAGSKLHLSLGWICDRLGRLMDAAQVFEHGAELAQLSGNSDFRIDMRINSAIALQRAGEWSTAIDRLESILADLRAIGATVRQPDIYLQLVNLYRKQGRLREAERAASDGLQIIAELQEVAPQVLEHIRAVGADLNTELGLVYQYTNRYASAEKHFQRSLDLYHKLNNYEMEAKTLSNLAGVRFVVGDRSEALRLYNLAYQMIEKLPPSPSHSSIYAERAIVLLHSDQILEARRMASLALRMKLPVEQVAQCLLVLMWTATDDTEQLNVQQQIEQLLATNPSLIGWFVPLSRLRQQGDMSPEQKKELRTQLRKIGDSLIGVQRAHVYLGIASLYDDTKADREAAIEDLGRCMALIDEVASNNPDRDIQRNIFAIGSKAAQRLLELEYVRSSTEAESRNDRRCLEIVLCAKTRATLHQGFTAVRTLDELQAQLSRQPAPVLLVEMYVLPKETVLYLVTAKGLQGVEHIPITIEVLMGENGVLERLYTLSYQAWLSETWKRVSDQFVGALACYLQPDQLVCLIPAGFWHFLPLHACELDGRPLIESHPVYYGPSSSILSRPGDAQRRLDHCLVVGVEFGPEAEWVANWFGVRAVPESLANPSVVITSMEDADVVHFSCHGAFNSLRASESGLILKNRGWLTPALIEQGTTAADLVTLSACETAFNFVTVGNDVIGLEPAFLNMGAVSVLGTLWKVDAVATERFVQAFYKHLTSVRGTGVKQMSKVHALQATVAQIRTDERFDHPFYWAPFKLTGGWL